MKKRIGLLLSLLVLPILTACGGSESSNKLICTNTQYDGALIRYTIIKYNYDGTQIVGAELEAEVNFKGQSAKSLGCETNSTEECINTMIKSLEEKCKGESNVENCKVSNKSAEGFTYTSHVKDSALEDYFSPYSLKTSKEDMKANMEAKYNTMVCK